MASPTAIRVREGSDFRPPVRKGAPSTRRAKIAPKPSVPSRHDSIAEPRPPSSAHKRGYPRAAALSRSPEQGAPAVRRHGRHCRHGLTNSGTCYLAHPAELSNSSEVADCPKDAIRSRTELATSLLWPKKSNGLSHTLIASQKCSQQPISRRAA